MASSKSLEMFVYSLFMALVWVYGLGVEACSSSKHVGEYRVIRKTDSDSDRVVVSLDEDTRLFCQTNAPWKKCLWRPPRSGVRQLHCLFTHDERSRSYCPSFPEVQFDEVSNSVNEAGVHLCAIVVHNVQEYHEGKWRCEFELEFSTKEKPAIVWETVRLDARGVRYHP